MRGHVTPKNPTAEGRPSTGPISGPSGKGRSFCSTSVEGFQRQTKRPQIHIHAFQVSNCGESKGYILHKPNCLTMGPHFFQIFFFKNDIFLVLLVGFFGLLLSFKWILVDKFALCQWQGVEIRKWSIATSTTPTTDFKQPDFHDFESLYLVFFSLPT